MNADNQEERHEHWRQLVEEQEKSSLSHKECKRLQMYISKRLHFFSVWIG